MSKNRPRHTSITHVFHCPSGYYLRQTIPPDLQSLLRRKEIRYSLRTGQLSVAKRKVRTMLAFLDGFFFDMRNRRIDVAMLTQDQIDQILREGLSKCRDNAEADRLHKPVAVDQDEQDARLTESSRQIWVLEKALENDQLEEGAKLIDPILRAHKPRISCKSETYRDLCREMMRQQVKILELSMIKEDHRFLQKEIDESWTREPEVPRDLLSAVIEQYADEQRTAGNWSDKSEFEVLSCLATLKEFVGDIPVSQIDHAKMRDYKQALMRLPANRSKMPQYRGKTIAELVKMDVPEPMSITSANKYVRWSGALFAWAVRNGLMLQNPAEGLKIKQPLRDNEFRSAFDKEDLVKLFSSGDYLKDNHLASYSFWMPILGLYTGARLNELCQLYLDDVREDNGIWLFDINEDSPDKSLKTKSAKRKVPLHPFLINDLRLPQYVDSLRQQGHTRLFPELPHKREGYGTYASKWFGRYKQRCGITPGKAKKDYHSFRSNVADRLKQLGVDTAIIHEVLGHAVQSISLSRYADPYQPKILLEKAISRLDYGIDLSHLTKSQYVLKT